jgi:hypothetical protein
LEGQPQPAGGSAKAGGLADRKKDRQVIEEGSVLFAMPISLFAFCWIVWGRRGLYDGDGCLDAVLFGGRGGITALDFIDRFKDRSRIGSPSFLIVHLPTSSKSP